MGTDELVSLVPFIGLWLAAGTVVFLGVNADEEPRGRYWDRAWVVLFIGSFIVFGGGIVWVAVLSIRTLFYSPSTMLLAALPFVAPFLVWRFALRKPFEQPPIDDAELAELLEWHDRHARVTGEVL